MDPLELYARKGMIVDWFPQGDESGESHPALVVQVAPHASITVTICTPASYQVIPQTGVRHLADPLIKREGFGDAHPGGWKHRPEQLAALRMMKAGGHWPADLPEPEPVPARFVTAAGASAPAPVVAPGKKP